MKTALSVLYALQHKEFHGSTLSEGDLWIIASVAVVAIGVVVALIVLKKKSKTHKDTKNDDSEE